MSAHRRTLIAKIHVAKAQLGLADDDYRAVLLERGGHLSAADMSDRQMVAVLDHFAQRGFTARANKPGVRSTADHPVATKARALWISLHHLGAIDDPSERALEAFAHRQLGVTRLQWADQTLGYKLIEALKAMADRAGWDQSLDGVPTAARLLVLKRRLVFAIAERMRAAGLMPAEWTIERAAFEFSGTRVPCLLTADLQTTDGIARSLGAKLVAYRNAKGEA